MADSIQDSQSMKKKIILLLVVLLILIIAAAIYIYLLYYKPATPAPVPVNQNINQPPTFEPVPLSEFNQTTPEILADVAPDNAQVLPEEQQPIILVASSFVERFGSFSNQSNYKNFSELDYFMTDSMQNWIPKYIEQLRDKNPDINSYYAIVTKALSSQLVSQDDNNRQAEILVKTQRQEFNGSVNNPRVYNQDITLNLIKVGEEWKVNGAYWQ